MARIARERDEALRENERLRQALVAARDKFTELDLPVYADACDAVLNASGA